ncbi:sensor histidine kinase [Metabacillus herbersteinensis]|uniref:histidine kinase n=1 Tax=Metabacillus herbersteinensis TaxID=283816 RepID=A0ABV6GJQ3_9BACI
MATKWRSRIAIGAWILLLTYGLSGIITAISSGSDYVESDYFHTEQFESELNQFIEYLTLFELNEISKDEAKKKIIVTTEDIEEHRYRYGDLSEQITTIKDQYEQRIQDAKAAGNEEVVETYTTERDKKIKDITANFSSDDHISAKIIKEKEIAIDEYFVEIEGYRSYFEEYKSAFIYYLKDTKTGEVYTNLENKDENGVKEAFEDKRVLLSISYPSAQYEFGNYSSIDLSTLPEMSAEPASYEGEIAIPKSASETSSLVANFHYHQQKQDRFIFYMISSFFTLFTCFFFAKRRSILSHFVDVNRQHRYNRLPVDVGIIGFGFVACASLFLLLVAGDQFLNVNDSLFSTLIKFSLRLVIASVSVALSIILGKLLFNKMKESSFRSEWQTSFIFKGIQNIGDVFINRRLGTQVLLLLIIVFAIGAGAIIVLINPDLIIFYAPLCFLIGLPILWMIVKNTGYFNRIVINTTELAHGNFEPDISVEGKSALATLANNVNTLKHGVKKSQKDRAKSERLKTELITNVSHDLRTPLTSIITYTELLKTPDLTVEDREAYIEIIDRKSKRLKMLIDDLFVASKMASGNIELVKERVDIVQLLQQSVAEYNETIKESTLDFRLINPDTPVYAIVDGQKFWRVFENLIGNILKYSLENTRVYLSVQSIEGKVVIIFKNVTKYELSENIDELFERFKRGDTSRHTDGSGLGLAIAKSIVDLHEGSLDIAVDGDLFKVTITLNKE